QITQEIGEAVQQAQQVAGSFGTVADSMHADTAKINAGVTEVAQSLSATNALLQRSQNTLYDVAQKSSDALSVFNDSIVHQTRTLHGLQQTCATTAGHMAEADERMQVLKTGFQTVLSEIMERLNGGLLSLGQHILSVKDEAQTAADVVARSGDVVTNQN